MRLDDRLAEGDIANGLRRGGPWLPVLADAGIELEELPLECRLIRHRLHVSPGSRALLASPLQYQLDRRAAQKGRGKDEGRPLPRVEEGELLLVARHAVHQVDPMHGRRRLRKVDEETDRGLSDVGEPQALRLAEQAPHPMYVM